MDYFNQVIGEVINALPPFRPEGLELEIRIPVFYDVLHQDKVEIPEHEHPFYEIAWMRQGEMHYLVDGAKISNNAENKQVFCLPAGKLHRRYSESTGSGIRSMEVALTPLGARGRALLEKLDGALEQSGYRFTFSGSQLNRIRIIENECRRPMLFSRAILQNEIPALLLDILQSLLPAAAPAPETAGSHKEICQYIQMRIEDLVNRSFEMKALTFHFHLSSRHLNRIFHAEHGMSIRRYAALRRIAHAERLLNDQSKTVADVAAALGFCNPSHFIAFFKKHRGITPARYRS